MRIKSKYLESRATKTTVPVTFLNNQYYIRNFYLPLVLARVYVNNELYAFYIVANNGRVLYIPASEVMNIANAVGGFYNVTSFNDAYTGLDIVDLSKDANGNIVEYKLRKATEKSVKSVFDTEKLKHIDKSSSIAEKPSVNMDQITKVNSYSYSDETDDGVKLGYKRSFKTVATVPEETYAYIQDRYALVKKLCDESKCSVNLTFLERIIKKENNEDKAYIRFEVEGRIESVEWQVVALLYFTEDQHTIVKPLVELEQPLMQKLYNIKSHCDLCGRNSDRVRTFYLRNLKNGRYLQIAKGCLDKYIGVKAINAALEFEKFLNCIKNKKKLEKIGFSYKCYNTLDLLTLMCKYPNRSTNDYDYRYEDVAEEENEANVFTDDDDGEDVDFVIAHIPVNSNVGEMYRAGLYDDASDELKAYVDNVIKWINAQSTELEVNRNQQTLIKQVVIRRLMVGDLKGIVTRYNEYMRLMKYNYDRFVDNMSTVKSEMEQIVSEYEANIDKWTRDNAEYEKQQKELTLRFTNIADKIEADYRRTVEADYEGLMSEYNSKVEEVKQEYDRLKKIYEEYLELHRQDLESDDTYIMATDRKRELIRKYNLIDDKPIIRTFSRGYEINTIVKSVNLRFLKPDIYNKDVMAGPYEFEAEDGVILSWYTSEKYAEKIGLDMQPGDKIVFDSPRRLVCKAKEIKYDKLSVNYCKFEELADGEKMHTTTLIDCDKYIYNPGELSDYTSRINKPSKDSASGCIYRFGDLEVRDRSKFISKLSIPVDVKYTDIEEKNKKYEFAKLYCENFKNIDIENYYRYKLFNFITYYRTLIRRTKNIEKDKALFRSKYKGTDAESIREFIVGNAIYIKTIETYDYMIFHTKYGFVVVRRKDGYHINASNKKGESIWNKIKYKGVFLYNIYGCRFDYRKRLKLKVNSIKEIRINAVGQLFYIVDAGDVEFKMPDGYII